MIALALALASATPSVLDAERAFAKLAQDQGQWTAFRKTADPEAVMFVPQPVKALDWLKDQKDPPTSVRWQPTAAWMSCDGTLAVTTGNWQRPDSVGYFTTVWKRQADGGWKWIVDSGDALRVARPAVAAPVLRRAKCASLYPENASWSRADSAGDQSADRTLTWSWSMTPRGGRTVSASIWTGRGSTVVIRDVIPASK